MLLRLLLSLSVVFVLAACSGMGDDEVLMNDADREGITEAPSALDEIYGESNNFGPAPGTQADLVVNVGDRVFFGYDRYDLTMEARQLLENQARWMQQYPDVTVTIEGHADERGTREYNLALGSRRANSVKSYLIANGVPANRISDISFGKERPAVPGANETAWAQNRRAVTVID